MGVLEPLDVNPPSHCRIIADNMEAANAKKVAEKPAIGKFEASDVLEQARQFLRDNDPMAPIKPLTRADDPMLPTKSDMEPIIMEASAEEPGEMAESEDSSSTACEDEEGNGEPCVVMNVDMGLFDVKGEVPQEGSAAAEGMTLVDIDTEAHWGTPEKKIQEI